MSIKKLEKKRSRARILRVRNKLKMVADAGALRLSVFRSNKFIYAQLIDDSLGKTIASASSVKVAEKMNGVEKARHVGKTLAEKIKSAGIQNRLYFDRGGFLYHGRVRAVAEGLRDGGVEV